MVLLTFNISLSENQTLRTKNISESELITSIEEKVNSTLLLLELHEFQATFFIDIILVEGLKKSIKSIAFAGHEIAFYNSNSDLKIIEKVKQNLEDFLQKPIRGLRQKYHQISYSEIKKLDFNYISNIEESKINFLWRK